MGGPLQKIVHHVANKMAFFPPQPPTYAVREHSDAPGELYLQPLLEGCRKVLQCKVIMVERKPIGKGEDGQIVAAFVDYNSRGCKTPRTLLFSHGNAVDLGQMLPFYRELSKELRVNVMGYDYSGYGCSSGCPSVPSSIADLDAVFQCLLSHFSLQPADIVLYGQSVGSGPSTDLAARTPGLAGLILHSPLMSGLRVLYPNWKRWPAAADVFVNTRLMPKVCSPVLIMHGTEDDVIDIVHGKTLHSLLQKPYQPLWAEGYTHQDLEMADGYLPSIKGFLRSVWPEYEPRP